MHIFGARNFRSCEMMQIDSCLVLYVSAFKSSCRAKPVCSLPSCCYLTSFMFFAQIVDLQIFTSLLPPPSDPSAWLPGTTTDNNMDTGGTFLVSAMGC